MIFSLLLMIANAGATEKLISDRSLDRLAAVQTFVTAGLSSGKLCAKDEAEVASALPQNIRAKIDAIIEERTKEQLFHELFADGKRIQDCESKCRCEFYLEWLGHWEGGADWKKSLSAKPHTNAKKIQRCAEANRKWICESALWSSLIKEAKAATESGS